MTLSLAGNGNLYHNKKVKYIKLLYSPPQTNKIIIIVFIAPM